MRRSLEKSRRAVRSSLRILEKLSSLLHRHWTAITQASPKPKQAAAATAAKSPQILPVKTSDRVTGWENNGSLAPFSPVQLTALIVSESIGTRYSTRFSAAGRCSREALKTHFARRDHPEVRGLPSNSLPPGILRSGARHGRLGVRFDMFVELPLRRIVGGLSNL